MKQYHKSKLNPDDNKEVYVVHIAPKQYDICSEAAQNMMCSSKPGFWGRGMLNTKEDPFRVERLGRLGEMAFGLLIKQKIDTKYRKKGDKYDFILNGKRIDVKTAAQKPKYMCGLVRTENEKTKKIDLSSDIYVFGYVVREWAEEKKAKICLVGYMNKEDIIIREKKPAKYGYHMNYECPYSELLDIGDLVCK